MSEVLKTLICECCNKNEAVGVACIPGLPMSAAYCGECLQANSHPIIALIANTACCSGLENCVDEWKDMVNDSLKHQGKSLEWFNQQVENSMEDIAKYGG